MPAGKEERRPIFFHIGSSMGKRPEVSITDGAADERPTLRVALDPARKFAPFILAGK